MIFIDDLFLKFVLKFYATFFVWLNYSKNFFEKSATI